MYEDIKAVIFDLDGTIYNGNKPMDGALELVELLRSLGKKILFMTNNSSKRRKQIFDKLSSMGLCHDINEVYSSGYAASLFIKERGLNKVFISGTENLKDEVLENGVDIVEDVNLAQNLLIGFDTTFDYEKMTAAVRVAVQSDKIMICNEERTFPGDDGELFPGCGGMVHSILWCANRNPDVIIGKPDVQMLSIISERNNLISSDILVIGDTYESDIVAAKKFGCESILISAEGNVRSDIVTVKALTEIIQMIG